MSSSVDTVPSWVYILSLVFMLTAVSLWLFVGLAQRSSDHWIHDTNDQRTRRVIALCVVETMFAVSVGVVCLLYGVLPV